jgi:hypothetical protein
MTLDPPNLDVTDQLEIDLVCERFESQWSQRQHPQIESFLGPIPERLRDPALLELLKIEFFLLGQNGHTVALESYQHRFPKQQAIVLKAWNTHQIPAASHQHPPNSPAEFGSSNRSSASDLYPPGGLASSIRDSRSSTSTLNVAASNEFPGDAAAFSSMFQASDRLGRYRVQRQLGQGAFGRVYLAHDEQLDRWVAIKVARSNALHDDPQGQLEEGRLLARLDHPGVVPVYDVGQTGAGAYFVVSKFIEGKTLADLMRERRFTAVESAGVVATVAEALDYAHEHKVVHRDVKPANILLDPRGRPILVDFGLAQSPADVPELSGMIGTPAYMSPEQASGQLALVTAQSDIFSLGVVLYELLTGFRPFHGETLTDLLRSIREDAPPPPRSNLPSLAASLDQICLKALAKARKDRYATAGELARELRRFLAMSLTDTAQPGSPPSAPLPSAELNHNTASQVREALLQLELARRPGQALAARLAQAEAAESALRSAANAPSPPPEVTTALTEAVELYIAAAIEGIQQHLADKNVAQAGQLARAILDRRPNHPAATRVSRDLDERRDRKLAKIRDYIQQQRWLKLMEAIRRARHDFPADVELAELETRYQPQETMLQQLYQRALALYKARRLRELRLFFDQLAQEGHADAIPDGMPEKIKQELIQLDAAIEYGHSLLRDGHFEQAARQLDALNKLVRDDPDVIAFEGDIARHLKRRRITKKLPWALAVALCFAAYFAWPYFTRENFDRFRTWITAASPKPEPPVDPHAPPIPEPAKKDLATSNNSTATPPTDPKIANSNSPEATEPVQKLDSPGQPSGSQSKDSTVSKPPEKKSEKSRVPLPQTRPYAIDFAPVKPPDLPAGWTMKGNLTTVLLDEGRKALKSSGPGPSAAMSPNVVLGNDFYLELELGTLRDSSLGITLIADDGHDFKFHVKSSGSIQLLLPGEAGHSTQFDNVSGLHPKAAFANCILRLERRDNEFRFRIDGGNTERTMRSVRYPDYSSFQHVEIQFNNTSTHVFGMRLGPLERGEELSKTPIKLKRLSTTSKEEWQIIAEGSKGGHRFESKPGQFELRGDWYLEFEIDAYGEHGRGFVDTAELRLILVGSHETPSVPLDIVISHVQGNTAYASLPLVGEKLYKLQRSPPNSPAAATCRLQKKGNMLTLTINGSNDLLTLPISDFEQCSGLIVDVPKPQINFKSLVIGPVSN